MLPRELWRATLYPSQIVRDLQPAPTRSRVQEQATTFALAGLWLFLTLAASYRWIGPGRDYLEYLKFYLTVTPHFLSGFSRFEIGFEFSAWLFSSVLGVPFEIFYLGLAAVSLALKFYLFRRYLKSPLLAAVAYALLFFPIHEYTQIRAAVAIGLAYYAVHALLEKHPWKAAAALLAAFTFHASIILVGVIGAGALLIPRRMYLPALVTGVAALLLFYEAITDFITAYFSDYNPLVSSYVENVRGFGNVNILSGTNILFMVTLLWMALSGWVKDDKYNITFFIMSVSSFVCLIVFRDSPVLALRTGEMLIVASLFLAFRPRTEWRTAVPQMLMLVNGGWFVYRAIVEGTLG